VRPSHRQLPISGVAPVGRDRPIRPSGELPRVESVPQPVEFPQLAGPHPRVVTMPPPQLALEQTGTNGQDDPGRDPTPDLAYAPLAAVPRRLERGRETPPGLQVPPAFDVPLDEVE